MKVTLELSGPLLESVKTIIGSEQHQKIEDAAKTIAQFVEQALVVSVTKAFDYALNPEEQEQINAHAVQYNAMFDPENPYAAVCVNVPSEEK